MSMRSFRKPVQIAEEFGKALDQDNFEQLKKLLAPQCTYCIGDIELIGPEAIASSYEQNMLQGRETLDELAWGESGIQKVDENEFILHFTDHLKHRGQSFIHRCQQRIVVGEDKTIVEISHIANDDETHKLNEFYKKVGLG
ncbi:MAG: hypothetical protein P8J33_01175 [Pirellulaceae bacterium]|nr:hypothetical protein [Pirellulaceae bacterium]